MTDIPPKVAAWLNADRLAADLELDGLLDADAIAALDMAAYARLRERAGLPSLEPPAPAATTDDPGEQISADAAIAAQYPGTPSFGSLSLQEYSTVRDQYIRPASGVGVGLFNQERR